MSKNDIKIVHEEWAYQGFYSVKRLQLQHTLFAGGWSPTVLRELVVRHPAVGVLPYDPDLDRIVLIEQFRVGGLATPNIEQHWFIEIVAGLIETPDESPAAVAQREAAEEANLKVLNLHHIADYWASPGGSNEYISLFCAKVDASQAGGLYGLAEEAEDIRVFTVSADEAFAMVKQGTIKNAMALIALLWLQVNRNMLREQWQNAKL